MRKRVTLKDVAQAVGVHVSTVSRALDPKTRHLITPEVAAEIISASERLDYRQNAAAYSLRTNRTRTIGVVLPDIGNPIFPPIIRGAEDALAKHDYLAILANTESDLRREESITRMLRARGVDGLILASVEREDAVVMRLADEGLPVVTVNRRVDDQSVPSVSHDEEGGVGRVVSHLVALGHRQVATIAGPQEFSTGAARFRAFRTRCAAAGLAEQECAAEFAEAFNEAEGERCAEALLASGRPFSAVVCSNDRLAIGAIAALQRHGRRCPDDVSVTGYNDMPMVDRLVPPLTTIRIEQYRAGFEAAELLYGMLQAAGDGREPRHIVLPVELIVRGSTKEYCRAGKR